VADAATLVALGIAFTRITTGNRLLVGALVAVALATQAAALAEGRARPRDG
jgi:predicted RecA/RadA family phage recombinase